MVKLEGDLTEEIFVKAWSEIAGGDRYLTIDSMGGDVPSGMEFVKKIKETSFEKELKMEIGYAGSIAAYIVFMLNCQKSMNADTLLIVHGGRVIEAESNELFEIRGTIREFYEATKKFIAEKFPHKLDGFLASNHATMTGRECFVHKVVDDLFFFTAYQK